MLHCHIARLHNESIFDTEIKSVLRDSRPHYNDRQIKKVIIGYRKLQPKGFIQLAVL